MAERRAGRERRFSKLCDGTKKLTVQAMGFSKSAEEKIIAAGGKVEVI